jgi:HAD superfamily hydrolase (TIGR01458 family)
MRAAEQIKGLLIDLSGTLYVDEDPIPGAGRALQALQAAGLPVLFVTNTTSRPRRRILERMARLGIAAESDEIFTAPLAAADALREAGHRRCHFLLPEPVLEDFEGFDAVDERPDAVVVGDIGRDFDYARLNRAFQHLEAGAAFYALAANRFFESGGALQLDVGPFVAALEYASGRSAQIMGKPSAAFFYRAAGRLGLQPGEIAVVGDDVESDVGGALAAGLRGVLVKTGKYRPEMAKASEVCPDAVLDSIADLPEWLGL